MPTYADRLRELAKLLDEDFGSNVQAVSSELWQIASSLVGEYMRRRYDKGEDTRRRFKLDNEVT